MADLFARMKQEAAAIASAPLAFLVITLAAGGVMWAVIHFSYEAALAGKNTQIVFLERRLAEWRDKMSGMSPDEARARLHTLDIQVKTLQMRLQPRRLTDEQRQVLTDRARQRPGVRYPIPIVREAGCSDCEALAAQITSALQDSSSWAVSNGVVTEPPERPRYGLGVRVADPLRPSQEAVQLQTALRSAGISFDTVAGGVDAPVELLLTERPVQ